MVQSQTKSIATVFAERVREARTAAGMSQAHLAGLLDMEKLQIGRWEKGDAFPRPAALEKLAAVTGKPVAWFFQEDDRELVGHTGPTLSCFGERIRAARTALDASQDKLGTVLGVEALQVGRWERGESFPKLASLEQLAELIDRPVAWFFLNLETDPLPMPELRPLAPVRIGDDRPPMITFTEVVFPLVQGLRQELDDPGWSEEGAATHQGEILHRARTRLGLSQELMAEQVLGWAKRRLSRIERGEAPTLEELEEYLTVLGITLDPPAWNAPTRVRGRTTEIVTDADGNPHFDKVHYPTKVDPTTWCPTCELYRLLYPNFVCSQHRSTDWELEEAMRQLERARKQLQRAEKNLARIIKARGLKA